MHFIEQLGNWKFYLLGAYPVGDLGGLALNIIMAFYALTISFFLSWIPGYLRLSKNKFISLPVGWYIDIVRSIPLLMLVFWFYFFLPYMFGEHITIINSAIISLVIYGSSYQAEIVRAGILAVPRGQVEASYSLGFTKFQTMKYTVLPQALKIMIPSFVSFFVSLFKDTSIAYIIGVVELVQSGVIVSQRQPNRMYAAYLCVAIGFWVVSFSISQVAITLEKKLGKLEIEGIRFGKNR